MINEKTILSKNMELKGIDDRLNCLQEECGEVIVAVNHYRRGKCSWKSVCEEMAHVNILIDQISLVGENLKLIEIGRKNKIKRLKEKLFQQS